MRPDDGWTALHKAVAGGKMDLARLLVERGADVDAVASTDESIDRTVYRGSVTPLLLALRAGHEDIALWLLGLGADVHHADAFNGETALYRAAQRGLARAVDALLARGARVEDARDGYTDETALEAAIAGGHVGIAHRLLDAGDKPRPKAMRVAQHKNLTELVLRLTGWS